MSFFKKEKYLDDNQMCNMLSEFSLTQKS